LVLRLFLPVRQLYNLFGIGEKPKRASCLILAKENKLLGIADGVFLFRHSTAITAPEDLPDRASSGILKKKPCSLWKQAWESMKNFVIHPIKSLNRISGNKSGRKPVVAIRTDSEYHALPSLFD